MKIVSLLNRDGEVVTPKTSATSVYFDSGQDLSSVMVPSETEVTFPLPISGTVSVAEKVGTSSIGSGTQPMYLSSGTPVASTSTVGGPTSPVYLNAGVLTQCQSMSASVSIDTSSSLRYLTASTGTSGSVSTLYTNTAIKVESDGNLYANGFYVNSALKYKENVSEFDDALDIIEQANVVKFNYKNDKEKRERVGFIADYSPELMTTPTREGIDIPNCIGLLMKAVQQLNEKVGRLTNAVHV